MNLVAKNEGCGYNRKGVRVRKAKAFRTEDISLDVFVVQHFLDFLGVKIRPPKNRREYDECNYADLDYHSGLNHA